MKADPIAFKRATNVSLIGLSLQIFLALTLLLYAIFGQDRAAVTAVFYLLLGVPVWIGLALLFYQHRLERLEAVEADLYASSSAAQASVFDEMGDELRVANKRLNWMHRVLAPVLSLIIAGLLIGIGILRLQGARDQFSILSRDLPTNTGWAVSLGLGVAVVGFIFARFVAGMAKEQIWGNLRAGAAHIIGASLVGLAIAVAHGVAFAGSAAILRFLDFGIAVFMIVIGVEILLNFLLNIYRPRKAGEIPRPAFDSRILGFFATPDRFVESISDAIDYQFGLNISSTWFYRLLSRSVLSLVLLAAVVIWAMSVVTVVRPHERALVLRNGRLVGEVGPGPQLKLPWPMGSVQVFPAESVQEVYVGPRPVEGEEGGILWTKPHAIDDIYFFVRPTPSASRRAGEESRDFSLLAIELSVQYRVKDLSAYRMLAVDGSRGENFDEVRRTLLRNIASRVLSEYAATLTVRDILGAKRSEMSATLERLISERFAQLNPDPETGEPRGAGIELLFVGVAGAHPPEKEDVARDFEMVVAAQQREAAMIERARAQAVRTLAGVAGDAELAGRIARELDNLEDLRDAGSGQREIAAKELEIEALMEEAGGYAATLIARAKADRWERHMSARSAAVRHEGRVALDRASSAWYRSNLYFDAIMDAADEARLYITTLNPRFRFNGEEVQTSIRGFEAQSANKE